MPVSDDRHTLLFAYTHPQSVRIRADVLNVLNVLKRHDRPSEWHEGVNCLLHESVHLKSEDGCEVRFLAVALFCLKLV